MAPKLQFGLHIGFLVNPSMHECIVRVAKAQGCTMSDVVRAALEHHLTGTDNAAPNASPSAAKPGTNGADRPSLA